MCSFKYCPRGSETTTSPSAPVCDWPAPPGVAAPTPDPRSASGGSSGFRSSSQRSQSAALAAGEERPRLLPSCSSPFLYIPLFHSQNLPAPPPAPPCSRRRSSHWEAGSPEPSECPPWWRLRAVKRAAGGRSRRPGGGCPDVGAGTSTTRRCGGRHSGRQYSDTEKGLGWKSAGDKRVFNNDQKSF